jgi:hypothetical protein
MGEQKRIKQYLAYPVNKESMTEQEKQVISDYYRSLSKRRWQNDKRTKAERSEYFRNLVKKRWQKRKESK